MRNHWHIENRLHSVRDFTYDEDRWRAGVRHLPRNLACLTNAATAIVRCKRRFHYLPEANRHYAARVQLRDEDIVVITRLDRLTRSTSELLRIAEQIEEKNAGLQSFAEPWADTTRRTGHMVLTVLAGIAEFERSLIATRTEEGRRAAQAHRGRIGRRPKLHPEQRTLARHLY